MENQPTLKDVICSEEFDNALNQGVTHFKEIHGSIKTRNKINYERFYDLVLKSRTDIQDILDTPAKNRSEDDIKNLKKFKKLTSMQYRLVKGYIFDDKNDDEPDVSKRKQKIAKTVEKIATVIQLMHYIGHYDLEDEFKKYGITMNFSTLEETHEAYENEHIHNGICEVFTDSCKIQQESSDEMLAITDNVFVNVVPTSLQYDKDTNAAGIKPADFVKLVSLASKVADANTDEAREKAENATQKEATNKTFDINRLETIRAKVMELVPPAEDKPDGIVIVEDNGVENEADA